MEQILFSKGLQHLSVNEAAEKIAEMEFAGVDLTVRPGGHVEPAQVKEKLPAALKEISAAGLALSLLTTDIKHPRDEHAEDIYRAAAECGVRFLKLGYIPYVYGTYRETLAGMRRDVSEFEVLGRKYGVCACHHLHSGDFMTQSALTVERLLEGTDPQYVGAYIDPCHLVIEGGLQGWLMGLEALAGKIRLVAVKDFRWPPEPVRQDEGFRYPLFVPLRRGTVPWKQVRDILRRQDYDGIFSFHMEYTGLSKYEELAAVIDDKQYFEASLIA